jgi:hypothetical protein
MACDLPSLDKSKHVSHSEHQSCFGLVELTGLCPDLRAAKLAFSNTVSPRGVASWQQSVLRSAAAKLECLCLRGGPEILPLHFTALKHLNVELGCIFDSEDEGPERARAMLRTVSTMHCLETLHIEHVDSADLGDLDLRSCPKLARVSLVYLRWLTNLHLPSACMVRLKLLACGEMDAAQLQVWQACAAQVSHLHCCEWGALRAEGVKRYTEFLEGFSALRSIEFEDTWDVHDGSRSFFDLTHCHFLAHISVLRLVSTTNWLFDGPGQRKLTVLIPAFMHLRVLIIADYHDLRVVEPMFLSPERVGTAAVNLTWENPDVAATCLEELFVPGLHLTGNLMVLQAGLFMRGLVLSTADCDEEGCRFYLYLKAVRASAISHKSLRARYASCDACGTCWKCCLAAMRLA